MNGNTAWNKWSTQLAISLGRDFERACLPFLRLIWPTMTRPTPLSKWDRQGIDLLVRGHHEALACVVQCKTSQKMELDSTDIREARASITAFRDSPHRCETFLVVINGDGRSAAFNKAVRADLEELVKIGKANAAELWDRQLLLNRTFVRMKQILIDALRTITLEQQTYFQSLFRFGHVYLGRVPVLEERLTLRPYSPCERVVVQPVAPRALPELIQDSGSARWTLVAGMFGTGKTTAALQASIAGEHTAIFVAARDFKEGSLWTGTNALAQEIVASLHIFEQGAQPIDEFFVLDQKDEETFQRLAGPALSSILRAEKADHVLLIDGLDEHRAYLHPDGLQLLNNALADFKCPIVLTTRLEHVETMFGSFEALFEGLGTKGRSSKPARLLTLHLWGEMEVHDFISQAMQSTESSEVRLVLEALQQGLRDGSARYFYKDLLYHPLFLQFILEDVAECGIRQRNRTQLIGSWVQRKVFRDIDRHGTPLTKPMDRYEFAQNIGLLMEAAAGTMTAPKGSHAELTEYIDSTTLEILARQTFGTDELPLSVLLIYSMLIPKPMSRERRTNVSFSLRTLQEYFLASHLARQNIPVTGFPQSVSEFHRDIVEGNRN